MPQYRRNFQPGGTFFFTAVSHERRPIWNGPMACACLHNAFRQVRQRFPFQVFAIVLLPDHLHTIWSLPPDDSDYSTRWKRIKEEFTRQFLGAGGTEGLVNDSRRRHRERAVWQRRFWEHTCRDEDDVKRCLDYLHWNPVKHGLVDRVRDYPWSSFHRFVALGEYAVDWGDTNPCPGYDEPEWE